MSAVATAGSTQHAAGEFALSRRAPWRLEVPGFFVHGYEEQVEEPGDCDRCACKLKSAYLVSYDGIIAKYRVCPACRAYLETAFGIREGGGGTGKPR
jgi:hypothetical protein